MIFGRVFLSVALSAFLSACGFSPAYGPTGTAAKLRESVSVRVPGSGAEFDFVSRMETRIGRSGSPRYELNYTLTSLGVGSDAAYTRLSYRGMVTWSLTDVATQTRVAGGQIKGVVSRSSTASSIASYSAEIDVNRRMAIMLADKLVTRLVALDLDS